MYQHYLTRINVLALSIIIVACSQTDSGVSSKVKTNLTADETVKAAQITVGVQDKIVTLSGVVDTQAVKERAVAVARATNGVSDVVDQITIQGKGYGHGSEHGSEMMDRGHKESGDH
jgi:hypothetical protein